MSISDLLMLETGLLDKAINLFELVKLIKTITCFLDKPLVVMLNLGLSIFSSLRTLYISLTFLVEIFRKFFSIFIMSLMLVLEACTYD